MKKGDCTHVGDIVVSSSVLLLHPIGHARCKSLWLRACLQIPHLSSRYIRFIECTYCTCVIQLFHAHDALRTFDPLMARASRLLVITRTSCCASWTRVSAKRQIAYSLEQTDMLEQFFFDGELDTKMVQLQHLHHNPSTPRH